MKTGDFGCKELSTTVGGCAVNTSRAANFYLKALPNAPYNYKVVTIGSIGGDESGVKI